MSGRDHGRLVPALLLVLAAAGCPAGGAEVKCDLVPLCDAPCCDAERNCASVVCEGILWVCLPGQYGRYTWQKQEKRCAADSGTAADGAPRKDAAAKADLPPKSCGAHASMIAGKCACHQGYVNKDKAWSNGCEAPDPACSVVDCGHCPAGYCGANAHCRDNKKCRCKDRNFKNADGNWKNGCEAKTTNCHGGNCNQCYVGFCGPYANCMQNKCKCTVTGYSNCDGKWELSGCECKGSCSGGKCK